MSDTLSCAAYKALVESASLVSDTGAWKLRLRAQHCDGYQYDTYHQELNGTRQYFTVHYPGAGQGQRTQAELLEMLAYAKELVRSSHA